MGGDTYSGSVFSSSGYSDYSKDSKDSYRRDEPDRDVLPKHFKHDQRSGLFTECEDPVVLCLDITGSMGNDAYVIRDKMARIIGQIAIRGYLKDPEFSIAFCGDAHSDTYPIQVTPFLRGDGVVTTGDGEIALIEHWLGKMYVEHGGGGGAKETYEYVAQYYLDNCVMPNAKNPIFFFLGDEGYYHRIDCRKYRASTGVELVKKSENSLQIIKALGKRFTVIKVHRDYRDSREDKKIVAAWKEAVGPQHFARLSEGKAIADAILGFVAGMSGSGSLEDFKASLKEDGQSERRVKAVSEAIEPYYASKVLSKTSEKKEKIEILVLPSRKGKVRK